MGRLDPVEKLTAEELHAELVKDAVRSIPTDLRRFVRVLARIAELRQVDIEQAYTDVRDEVIELTGHSLPVG